MSTRFVLVADGDSITAGTAVGGLTDVYPYYVIANSDVGSLANLYTSNIAVGGDYATDVIGRIDLAKTNYYRGLVNVYSCFIGTNDLASNTGQEPTLQTNVASIWAQMRAAGFKVIAFTLLPRALSFSNGQTSGGFETDRQTFNTWVRNNSSMYDALCDVGNDPNYGQPGDSTNSYYVGDGIHPTAATEALIASTYYGTAIETIYTASTGLFMGLYSRIAGFMAGPISWIAGSAPGLQQAQAVSGAGQNFPINPQAPNGTGACGSLMVGVTAPASGTIEAGILLKRIGTLMGGLQAQIGSLTRMALYGPGTPLSSNYLIGGDGASITVVNAPAGGSLNLDVGAVAYLNLNSSAVELGSGTTIAGAGFTSAIPFDNALSGAAGQPLLGADSSVTLATSGTTTLSAAQLITPSLTIATVSLTGNATLAFGAATVGGVAGTSSGSFDLDCSAVTLSGHTLTLSNGTATFNATTLLGTKTLLRVKCQTNTIAVG